MKNQYDKEADARHIYFKKGKVARTRKDSPWFLVDLAGNGDVLGVEILQASKHPVSISLLNGRDLFCDDVIYSNFQKDKEVVEMNISNNNKGEMVIV